MSSIKTRSIEELLSQEQELASEREEGAESLRHLIAIREKLYREIAQNHQGDNRSTLKIFKESLVSSLMTYGSYLKMAYRKDELTGENSLKKVLYYDQGNPIAHFCLGILAYKHRNYLKAVDHFKRAINSQNKATTSPYELTVEQIYQASLYLSNSALHIATAAHDSCETIPLDITTNKVANLEMASIYKYIASSECYLKNHAYTVRSEAGEEYLSEEVCEAILDDIALNKLVLYYGDHLIEVNYNGKSEAISIDQALLLEALMASSIENPITRYYDHEDLSLNAFIRRMNQLQYKIKKLDLPYPALINQPVPPGQNNVETLYHYNAATPYLILKQTDRL